MNVGDLKTIGENWRSFESLDIPSDAPEVQRNAMRQAFYAGAASIIMLACMSARDHLRGDSSGMDALAEELKEHHRQHTRKTQ